MEVGYDAKIFGKLDVWRKGHALALSIYRTTTPFPPTKDWIDQSDAARSILGARQYR